MTARIAGQDEVAAYRAASGLPHRRTAPAEFREASELATIGWAAARPTGAPVA